jgi:hypothetical protein
MKNTNKRFEDYDDVIPGPRRSIKEEKRRPVKNLKHAWEVHAQDFEDFDDFYGR